MVPRENRQSTKPGFPIATDSAMKAFTAMIAWSVLGWGREADWEVAKRRARVCGGDRPTWCRSGWVPVVADRHRGELYLAQKLARGLGVANIDHRLRQADFSDQDAAPIFPWLGRELADLEKVGAALLINQRTDGTTAGWPSLAQGGVGGWSNPVDQSP